MKMSLTLLFLSFLSLFNACNREAEKIAVVKSVIKQRHILNEKISETSGIISYNGLIWTFNDSGGKPVIYGYNLVNDSIEQMITLKNAVNKDWEDIAQDDEYIYVGDIGNNQGTRDSLVIYKLAKAAIPKTGNASITSEAIVFSYHEYKPVSIPVGFSSFDCEALIVIKDSLYLFTKDWNNGNTTIYSLSKKPGKSVSKKINNLNVKGLITGADFYNGKLVLIGYSNFIPFIIEYTITNLSNLKHENGKRFELNEISTYQTEGICFDGAKILISSEKTRAPAQIIELIL